MPETDASSAKVDGSSCPLPSDIVIETGAVGLFCCSSTGEARAAVDASTPAFSAVVVRRRLKQFDQLARQEVAVGEPAQVPSMSWNFKGPARGLFRRLRCRHRRSHVRADYPLATIGAFPLPTTGALPLPTYGGGGGRRSAAKAAPPFTTVTSEIASQGRRRGRSK
jgi:hypothetical protein